jgi:crossover junction endodeoxyribonuclease RusA
MIELPFPPSSLSGHAKGNWHGKSSVTAKHRSWARNATLAANLTAPASGDIRVIVAFYPPNRRGDRVNYPNRMKPYFDGIADALKVNDSRFVPSYIFAEPVKNPRVVVSIEGCAA